MVAKNITLIASKSNHRHLFILEVKKAHAGEPFTCAKADAKACERAKTSLHVFAIVGDGFLHLFRSRAACVVTTIHGAFKR